MHDHSSAVSAAGQHRSRLAVALALVVALLVVEVTVAWVTGSLALLSDAGHLATDVLGLGLALAAVTVAASRRVTARSSFGWWRLEILAALANALLLLGLAVFVLVEVVRRWSVPHQVAPGPLMVVASVALLINVICVVLLRSETDSLNLAGARLEVLADAVGSVGVLVSAAVIWFTGWARVDSLVAVAIVVWLVPRALWLGGRALRVLLQYAPADVDVELLTGRISKLDGVVAVHDVHVWTLTSGMHVASLHVIAHPRADHHDVRHDVDRLVRESSGIDHVTIQVEAVDDPECCVKHPAGW